MPCSLNQLNRKYSQTSSGTALSNVIRDRESGKAIVIQYPSFDLMMSDSSLSFQTDSYRLSPNKLTLLLKCLLIIQTLQEAAIKEASEELDGIYCFYMNRLSQVNLPTIPVSSLRGRLGSTQVRPPIVLEP